ncbi:MAG: hypothetical protein U5J99_05895 [Parvularculaceae bacterium]|nr:hypothetical protein [Parvularculaceae bacterium]
MIDAETGSEVVGAEDLDIDRANGRIFASAYDRRVSEKAAKNKAPSIPGGGIYAIDLSALLDARGSLKISSMISAGALEEGLRPHGISFDKNTGALDFINRGYSRDGSNWRMTPQILRIDLEGAITSVADDPECSANDVAAAQGRLFVTLDHGSCGWRASLEDIFGGKHGRLVDAHRTTLLSGIGFANGVIVTDDGRLFVAATRDKAVLAVTVDENGATAGQKASALGAPDNLTLSDRGNVVAAVHPSLLSLGMQRRLGIGRSPSRVVEFDFDRGKLHVLFDDPKASLISAASAAVLSADALIIGSVLDRGLVVCRKDPAAL